ncbi:hypothetical protein [Ideonella sp. A 288]|nr:hypothetical protein [Ideonella sp. A 288]
MKVVTATGRGTAMAQRIGGLGACGCRPCSGCAIDHQQRFAAARR